MSMCGFSFDLTTSQMIFFDTECDFTKWNGWFNSENTELNWTDKYAVLNKM